MIISDHVTVTAWLAFSLADAAAAGATNSSACLRCSPGTYMDSSGVCAMPNSFKFVCAPLTWIWTYVLPVALKSQRVNSLTL